MQHALRGGIALVGVHRQDARRSPVGGRAGAGDLGSGIFEPAVARHRADVRVFDDRVRQPSLHRVERVPEQQPPTEDDGAVVVLPRDDLESVEDRLREAPALLFLAPDIVVDLFFAGDTDGHGLARQARRVVPPGRIIRPLQRVRDEAAHPALVQAQPRAGQFPAVPGQVGELQAVVLPPGDAEHPVGFARRFRGFAGGAHEGEGHAEDVGDFGAEQPPLFVGEVVVGGAAERSPDHLFAQEFAPELAEAEDVGDGPRVPAFGEHGHRDDAADALAGAVLADGLDDLPQPFEPLLTGLRVGREQLPLFLHHRGQVAGQFLRRVEFGVDQDRRRGVLPSGAVGAHIREEGQAARPVRGLRAVFGLLAGDPAVELGGVLDIVRHHDHHRDPPRLRVLLVRLLVVLVQGFERRPHGVVQVVGVEPSRPRVLVEVPVDRRGGLGVVVHRDAGDLGEPGFHGFDQRVVADDPGEDGGFEAGREAQVHRRRREVGDPGQAALFAERPQRPEPQRRALLVFAFLAGSPGRRGGAVAVVPFVVQHQDLPRGAVRLEQARQHLLGRFLPLFFRGASAPAQEPLGGAGGGVPGAGDEQAVGRLELVEVEDGDAGGETRAEMFREERFVGAPAGRRARVEFRQAFLYRQVRRDDQDIGAPPFAQPPPGDHHRHGQRLPGAGRHLDRDAIHSFVARGVHFAQPLHDPGVFRRAEGRAGFLEPDQGFDGLALTEEGAGFRLARVPVVEEIRGALRHSGPAPRSPVVHGGADAVDQRVRGEFGRGEREFRVAPGQRDREVIAASPPALDQFVGGPEVPVEPPVPARLTPRVVEDRVLARTPRGPILRPFCWQVGIRCRGPRRAALRAAADCMGRRAGVGAAAPPGQGRGWTVASASPQRTVAPGGTSAGRIARASAGPSPSQSDGRGAELVISATESSL